MTKFVGVLAGAPAVLRAYTRMRSELRGGVLPQATRERIALAVAEHRERHLQHRPAREVGARAPGLGLDEVSRPAASPRPTRRRRRCSTYLKAPLEADGRPPQHLHEEAREIGWTDEEILEAVAHLALNEFQSLIASAAALPKDQATPRVLPSAA